MSLKSRRICMPSEPGCHCTTSFYKLTAVLLKSRGDRKWAWEEGECEFSFLEGAKLAFGLFEDQCVPFQRTRHRVGHLVMSQRGWQLPA